jgi:hypothetical protein
MKNLNITFLLSFFVFLNLNAQTKEKPIGFFGLGLGIGATNNQIGINVPIDVKMNNKFGFSIDILLSGKTPSDQEYMSNVSWQSAQYSYNDTKTGEMESNLGFNIDLNYTILKNFSLVAGIAHLSKRTYWKYFDNYYILGNSGNYVVDYSNESFYGLSYGGIYEINNFYIKAINSTLNYFAFSVGYKIPFTSKYY